MTKKISILKYDQLLKRKLSIIVSEINDLFNNSNNKIIRMLINKNIKTRTNKLTFNDALLYKFKCAFENSYNKSIANEINFTKVFLELQLLHTYLPRIEYHLQEA